MCGSLSAGSPSAMESDSGIWDDPLFFWSGSPSVNSPHIMESAYGADSGIWDDPLLCWSRSPSVGSPHIVESVHGADSRIWSDLLLQWSDCSGDLPRRYVWIHATSARDLHLEHAPSGEYTSFGGHAPLDDIVPLGIGTALPPRPPAGRAGQLQANLSMRNIAP